MKKHMMRLFGLSFFLFFMSAQAQAETLFGYEGLNATLYTIDTTTPTATAVGTGNTGRCSEIELGSDVIYAAETAVNTNLHSIHPAKGLITSTLTMTFPTDGNVLTALEFVGGTLYAGLTTEMIEGASYLATVNLTTGIVTTVGATGVNSPLGGLAYDTVSGTMYACSAGGSGELFTVNLATGAATSVGLITVGATAVGTTALEFGPSGTLYALPNVGSPLRGHLLSVNPATGAATDLGDLGVEYMNALTADTRVAPEFVPTLSEWGMIVMGLLLFFMAFKMMRKNRDVPAL